MKVTQETITPALAKSMLAKNTHNRAVKKKHVAAIARDMADGNWKLNGDSIRFNCDGELLDGQHRLHACVRADKPFETLVVKGLEKATRKTMDAGIKRTIGDQMALAGIRNGNAIAASCRYAMICRSPKIPASSSFTTAEVFEFYEEHSSISDFNQRTQGKVPLAMGSIISAVGYISSIISPSHTDEFIDAWIGGAYERDHPVNACREKLIKRKLAGQNIATVERLRTAAFSLNKLIAGERVSRLMLPESIALKGWNK